MSGCVAVGEIRCKIDCARSDILLISLLAVEIDELFNGTEVFAFVITSSGVFDVPQRKLVLAGGGNRRASLYYRALEAVVTVAVYVFFATVVDSRCWLVRNSANAASGYCSDGSMDRDK